MDAGSKDSRRLGELLLSKALITDKQLQQAITHQNDRGTQLGEELLRMGVLTQDDLNAVIADQFGLEIIGFDDPISPPKEMIEKIPYAFARKHGVLPIAERDGAILVAVSDPLHLEPLDDLRMILGMPVEPVYCPLGHLKHEIHRCYEGEQGAASKMIARLPERSADGIDGEPEVYDLLDSGRGQDSVVKLLNLMLTEAIQQEASDVHFEPSTDGMKVRYRIDGVLQDRHSPSQEYQAQLTTRIKVMAKLDIAERRLPQDGRIKLQMGTREVDFRVSTVPTSGGERIVLRILDKGNVVLGLEHLGMPKQADEWFRRLIKLPEGIILVTGPTGSGKTTTLYSAISQIQSSETNIMTVEDPVEYKLPGIAQIAIRSKIGLTFAAGLRHILRQDPDVIMVGEIRDKETADISVQASLTGHLVMSTLHTNDAPSAITRLVDMGVEPYLLSSTVVGVLAQRLIRKICSHCSEKYTASDEEMSELGIKNETLMVCRGKGCDHCFGSGYSGRRGIYELMPVDSAIQRQIVKSPDAIEMRRIALEQGMHTLRQHGAQLVREGVTTVAEVLRVTRGASL